MTTLTDLPSVLDADQQLLAETAGQLATRLSGLATGDTTESTGRDGWQRVRDVGWCGLRQRHDGRPLATAFDAGLVTQAFGGELVGEPLAGSLLAVELLELAHAPVEVVEAAATGATITVPVLGPTLAGLAGGGSGVAWDFAGATRGIVLDGDTVALVDLTNATPIDTADPSRRLGRVTWSSGDLNRVGTWSADVVDAWTAFALAQVSCELVGVMEAALALALGHAVHRSQFDRPIASFQAIQHICADQLVSIEGAKSAAHHAAWAVDALDPADALLAGRVAKVACGQAARGVAEAAIQVHGGIGMTWECNAHRFLRRVLVDRQVLGSEAHHLHEIADRRIRDDA